MDTVTEDTVCTEMGTGESDCASGGGTALGVSTSSSGDLGTGKLMSAS